MMSYLEGSELFVQDCYAGADPEHRLGVRVVTETAWHNLFAPQHVHPAARRRA